MLTNGVKLPACERCRIRKTRCDGAVPKCTSCTKSNSACIIVDSASQEKLSRGAVHELELRLQELESKDAERSQKSPAVVSPTSATHRRQQSLYVGDGSGLNLFSEVSRNAGGHHERVELLRQLTVTSPSAQRQANVHPLPPYEQAAQLLNRYLSHSHLYHPFMAWHDVHETLERVYVGNPDRMRPDDLYRLFMLFAISTVTSYRRGETSQHPYGYYHAAQAASGGVRMDGTARSIQNILLIARFAMYYHVDCSIWDLSRLCMRQCIELGFHRPPTKPITPVEEQVNRDIFWDCYLHDRYSSGIIGRPYAISEEDITVKLPISMREQDIATLPVARLDDIDVTPVSSSSHAFVPLFVIKLRRITTQIQTQFFSSKTQDVPSHQTIREAAKLQANFDQFWHALDLCLGGAPRFTQVQSLYERPQWYEFMVEKDRLLLIRGIISKQPLYGLKPSVALLHKCVRCASKVIILYSTMYELKQITWTRSYFQIMFTTGLSLLHSLSGLDLRLPPADSNAAELRTDSLKALAACRNVLYQLVREMPDVARFAYIFDALSRQTNGVTITAQASDAGHDDRNLSSESHNIQPHTDLTLSDTSGQNLRSLNTDQSNIEPRLRDSSVKDPANYNFGQSITSQQLNTSNDAVDMSFDSREFELPELPFDFDPSEYQGWPNFAQTDNVLGQMEAGLGEYAWGYVPNDSTWMQYFA